MWVTLFALATTAAVWFSAANLAIQFSKQGAAFNSAIESREQMRPAPYRHLSSADAGAPAALRFD
jgi:hypothetical protein